MQYTEYVNRLFFKSAAAGIPLSGTFELTARCNLRCKMCYIHRQESDAAVRAEELSATEWVKIAEAAKERGMLLLLLTGGEPLLRPDFAEIYAACQKMGLMVSINSNGTLLNDAVLQVLTAYLPQRVNLTLYGASPETYERLCLDASAYERAYRAVELLLNAGISVKLNFSATPENIADLPAVTAYAKSKNLPLQTASYMFPPVRAAENTRCESCQRLSPEQSAQVRWQSECSNMSFDNLLRRAEAIARNHEIPAVQSECQDMPTEHIRCRAGAAAFWITYNGQMRPCGMMDTPSALLGDDFTAAWDHIRSERKKIMVPARCTACRYHPICEACPAVCMAETGKFASVPEYMCRKMDTYASFAALWYEQTEKETQEKTI